VGVLNSQPFMVFTLNKQLGKNNLRYNILVDARHLHIAEYGFAISNQLGVALGKRLKSLDSTIGLL
jgi:hypothetical protein